MADEPAGSGPEGGEGGAATAAATTAGADDRQFTQADIDRVVKERLARQKDQFKDYDELRAKAQKLDELEAKSQTETEKALAAIERANKQAQEATEREQTAIARANETLIRAEVVGEAAKRGAIDPQDVYGLLDKTKVTVGDDGQVTGAAAAVEELLKAKPHLVGRSGGGFDGGARGAPAGAPGMNDLVRSAAGFGAQR